MTPVKPKKYAIIGVESSAGWPAQNTTITFRGVELLLRPPDGEKECSIVIAYEDPATHDEQVKIANEFLSSWAWAQGVRLETGLISGGGTPHWVGRIRKGSVIQRDFDIQYLPDPADTKARLALAFYREGLNLENISYKFLSFFKIINVIRDKGNEQKGWIQSAIPHIRDSSALQRLGELQNSQSDVAEYLYQSGRCAVAHAYVMPLVNPENPADTKRLHQDLSVIKALAEYAIENDLGVKSRHTIWKEHLYELDGFRKILGDPLVARLKRKDTVAVEEIPPLPRISLGLTNVDGFAAFSSLDVRVLEVEDGCVFIEGVTAGGRSGIILGLNFADERLSFDPERYVFVQNRNDLVTAQNMVDQLNLIRGLVLNGQLDVVNADSGELLGRTDPCIPTNIDGQRTIENLDKRIQNIQEQMAWYEHSRGR